MYKQWTGSTYSTELRFKLTLCVVHICPENAQYLKIYSCAFCFLSFCICSLTLMKDLLNHKPFQGTVVGWPFRMSQWVKPSVLKKLRKHTRSPENFKLKKSKVHVCVHVWKESVSVIILISSFRWIKLCHFLLICMGKCQISTWSRD